MAENYTFMSFQSITLCLSIVFTDLRIEIRKLMNQLKSAEIS